MRWIAYIILAYFMIGLQIGLTPYVKYRDASPNFVLMVVVFLALNAPREAAWIGAVILGLMQDLTTLQPPGLFALSYGLVALFVTATGQIAYRDHPLTHFVATLFGGIMTTAVLIIQSLIYPPRIDAQPLLISAIFTAILAPFILGVLCRMKGLFAFEVGRRRG